MTDRVTGRRAPPPTDGRRSPPGPSPIQPAAAVSAATRPAADTLREFGVTTEEGLSSEEVARRLGRWGPNAVSSHRARLLAVLWHQLRSPLLGLLLAAATASYFVGERSDAVIIGVIVGLSVGLGFVNE